MVKDHSDSEKGNPLQPYRLLFPINSKGSFVTPVVEHWLEREIAQWTHPMKDRSDDPSHHERMLLPQSYISPRIDIDACNQQTFKNALGSILHGGPTELFLVPASAPRLV